MSESATSANQLFHRLQEDIWKRQLSNCQERDRAVLTMATAMLAISLTFIDKVVTISNAIQLPVLYLAWSGFVITIILTLSSFHVSQGGLERQLELGRKYYLENDQDAYEHQKKGGNRGKTWTERLNWLSSVVFVLAVMFLVAFIGININHQHQSPAPIEGKEKHVRQ